MVCLGSCSTAYSNGNLPDSSFAGPTAFAFCDDLMIYANTAQTVYSSVDRQAPNRSATFEFYESHISTPGEYYHFQVVFYENAPGIVKYIYFEISDGGASATVGVQRKARRLRNERIPLQSLLCLLESGSGPAITYSANQPNAVTGNMTLTFNTNTGTYTG